MVKFKIPSRIATSYVNNKRCEYSFKFNGVIDQDASQDDVFDVVAKVQNHISFSFKSIMLLRRVCMSV